MMIYERKAIQSLYGYTLFFAIGAFMSKALRQHEI